MKVDLTADSGVPKAVPTVAPWIPKSPDTMQVFGADDGSLVGEFLAGQTARGAQAQKEFPRIVGLNPGIDRVAFDIESAIAFAEKWAPASSGIGGEIDVLELGHGGPIHWLKVKDKCRK